jgi:hypothetical protein
MLTGQQVADKVVLVRIAVTGLNVAQVVLDKVVLES